MANAVVIDSARNKMLMARAGEIPLAKVAQFAFGTGGTDESGEPIKPNRTDLSLKNEVFRKDIDGYEFISSTQCRYSCTLLNSELVGKVINEVALIDADGDIIAIKTFRDKTKDDDLEMTFQIDDLF